MMKLLGLSLVAAALCTAGGPALAGPDTAEVKAAVCGACHGQNGVPVSADIPVIWGQQEGYIYLQLRDYKKGTRANKLMSAIAASLEKEDMRDLAAYFAAKSWPGLNQPAASDDDTALAKVANASIGCTGCHLAEYQGTGTAPRLAGQSKEYLTNTLDAFRSNARANNPGMTSLAQATPAASLAAVEAYLAGY